MLLQRDFDQLRDGPFDLLIIGGGVYGAWTALDAALRGLKVALVDKGDWACGTSMASTKLIHGGLRYLEQLRLDLVHASLEERRTLTAIAPHRVRPLRFFIPTYDNNRVGPIKLKTGLWLYDLMAGKNQPVPPHEHLNHADATARYPFLHGDRLSGGFIYGDCQTDDCRMVLDVVSGARHAGAVAVNYAQVMGLLSQGRRVKGAAVQDMTNGAVVEVRAPVVVNAAGPWVSRVDNIHMLSSHIRYSKGVHLVMPPLPTEDALLLMTRNDKRIFFIVPWYGKSLVGTTDTEFDGHPDEVGVEVADVDYLLTQANRHLKDVGWDRGDILGAFAGLRTLQNEPGKPLSQVTREWMLVEPRPGLLVSIGGKFTTARLDAAKMVSRVLALLDRPNHVAPPTEGYSFASTPKAEYKTWRRQWIPRAMEAGLDHDMAAFLALRFGATADQVLDLIDDEPALAHRIAPDLPFCRAEVIHCARNEMAVHLEDVLRRRIPLTILSRPDPALARAMAELAAPELGWSTADLQTQVTRLMAHWTLP
jgi:glycerol-3-phosphate dehydrogenase